MKKFLIISILIVFCISISVFAEAAKQSPNTVKAETPSGIVFAAGTTVYNDRAISDDFIAAGQMVINTGKVNGDIIAAGRNLSLAGNVGGNIRAAGFDISLTGTTAKNVTVAANIISIDKSAVIQGTTMAAASSITVSGTLNRPLYATGENVIIDGIVAGDVNVKARSLTILPGAKINGNLFYTSEKDANITPETVLGTVTKKAPPVTSKKIKRGAEITEANILFKLLWSVGSFLLGVVLIKLFGRFFNETPDTIRDSWFKYLGIGLVTLIVVPLASIILLVTIIGIPIAITAMMAYALLILLAKIPVSIFIGGLILKGRNIYLKLLVGLGVLTLLYLIPFIGGLTCFITMLLGLGLYVGNVFFVKKKAVIAE